MNIKKIVGRQLLDSRGFPTVEAEVYTNKGNFKAMVASGASTGEFEALELRDGEQAYMGKGVMKAVNNINKIIGPALKDKNVEEQFSIDKIMYEQLDGSKNEYGWVKSKLGANSILAVSLAIARAGAYSHDQWLFEYIAQLAGNQHMSHYTLPIPAMNVINGGKHAENTLAFQEFMILPVGCNTFSEAIQSGSEIYHTLKKLIGQKFGRSGTSVGDEGGFAPDIKDEIEALDILTEAIEKAGYKNKVKIGIDVAASELWDKEKQIYDLSFKWKEGKRQLSAQEMIKHYSELIQKYPIISIEDPLYENDFDSWVQLTQQLGNKVQIVGDDLLVTNPSRIKMALDPLACTLYESIEACNLAQNNEWNVMVSHRSGETEDHFIADLVVGLNAKQIKTGAPCRSERTAKYNQLLRIEEYLGNKAKYAGNDPFKKYTNNNNNK